ncbi:MAG: hypothetical protein ACTS5I_02690, partial [Rhodanobacter sp.]
YYADVYIEFDATGALGVKWDGRLYLEVHHKHAVEAEKQKELRELGVPVVEVEIPDIFRLNFDEEDTSDEREENYRKFVKRTLEGERGFLKGTVLGDPNSKAFLEQLVGEKQRKLQELERSTASLVEELTSAKSRLEETNSRLTVALETNRSAREKRDEFANDLEKIEEKRINLLEANEILRGKISSLTKSIRSLLVALLFFVGLSIFLGMR